MLGVQLPFLVVVDEVLRSTFCVRIEEETKKYKSLVRFVKGMSTRTYY